MASTLVHSKGSNLARREILLVGGAGGLGAATAALLEAEGAFVVISSRQRGLRADISQAADRKWLLDAVPKLYGLVVFPARGEGPVLLAREAAERMNWSETKGVIVLFVSPGEAEILRRELEIRVGAIDAGLGTADIASMVLHQLGNS